MKTPREYYIAMYGIKPRQTVEGLAMVDFALDYHKYAIEHKISFLKSQLKYPDHDDFGRGQYDGIQKAIEILTK